MVIRRTKDFFFFGWSPQVPLPLGATHMHNFLLETMVLGGLVGVLAAGFLAWQAAGIASRAAIKGDLVLTGTLMAFLIAGQSEMPINYRSAVFLPHWFILLLALGATITSIRSSPHRQRSDREPGGLRRTSIAMTRPSLEREAD
jgi:O-antigen ligase